ncbi:MAG: hypothetical protein ACXVCD_19540 [Pseudobdellovibrionaceae bacterium]
MERLHYKNALLLLFILPFAFPAISAELVDSAQVTDGIFESYEKADPEVKNLLCQYLNKFDSYKKSMELPLCGFFTDLDIVTWNGRKEDSHSSANLHSKGQVFYADPTIQDETKNQLNKIKNSMVHFCCQNDESCKKSFLKVGAKFCSDTNLETKCVSSYVHYELSKDEFYLKWWNMNSLAKGKDKLLPTIQAYAPNLVQRLGEIVPGDMVMPEDQFVDDPLRQNYLFAHELSHACLSIKSQIQAAKPNNLTFNPSAGGAESEAYCQYQHKNFSQLSVLGIESTKEEYRELKSCIVEAIDQDYQENLKAAQPRKICYGSKYEESMADAMAILSAKKSLGVFLDTLCRSQSDEVHLKGKEIVKCLVTHSHKFRKKLSKYFKCD